MNKLILGTRGSKLALAQTEITANEIRKVFPQTNIEIKIIKTLGDKIINISLNKINDKGFFVKEIQHKLINKNIDIAVHSMKDLPVNFEKTKIAAILEREDPRDVLLSLNKNNIKDFNNTDSIGTTSLRRKTQIKKINDRVKIVDIRGNVDTRIKKMINGYCDGLILAYAGVKRLNLERYIKQFFDVKSFVPAPAQGAIALEINKNNVALIEKLKKINNYETMVAVNAERSFLKEIDGGCHLPFGCYAEINKKILNIHGYISSTDGKKNILHTVSGDIKKYNSLGKDLALQMLNNGGKAIIKNIKKN